jgi:hypothetical protein
MVSTIVLDVQALALVRELLDDLPLPASFVAVENRTADPAQVAIARASAAQRLRTAGLLIPAETGRPIDPEALAGTAAQDVVHPSLRAALEGFGRAGLRIEVRSWAGDRAVVSDLAIGSAAGIGLARLQRVTRERPDATTTVQDALGVELAIFESGDTLAAIERLLPPLPESSTPLSPVRVSWPEGLALLALLRKQDSIAADQLPVAREVLKILLATSALAEVPPLLDWLAGPLEAAIRITFSVRGPAGSTGPIWFGYWLQCDGHLVGLRAELGPDPVPGPPERTADAVADAGVVLTLVPADGPTLRADLTLALTGAFAALDLIEQT